MFRTCVFLCFRLDSRPTRADAALRATPLERGWAIIIIIIVVVIIIVVIIIITNTRVITREARIQVADVRALGDNRNAKENRDAGPG